jgi:hypothetical protein
MHHGSLSNVPLVFFPTDEGVVSTPSNLSLINLRRKYADQKESYKEGRSKKSRT